MKNNDKKLKKIVYLLWLVGIFGWLGFHRFYLDKPISGLVWMFSFELVGMGCLIDLGNLGQMVEWYNWEEDNRRYRHKIKSDSS